MTTTLRTVTISLTALSALVAPAHATGVLSLVASTDKPVAGKMLTAIGPAALNYWSSLAFVADFSGGSGVFAQNSWVAQTGQVIQPKTITGLSVASAPGFNDSGTVSFWAQFSGGDGIFTQNGIRAQTGQSLGGSFTLAKLFGPTSLNASGQIAFIGQDTQQDVFVLSDTNSPFINAAPGLRPSLNNAGSVAVLMTLVAGLEILNGNVMIGGLVGSSSGLQPDQDPASSSSPSLNAKGTAVLGTQAADLNTFTVAIFTTPHSVVAKIGDVIGGEAITSFRGLNNAGDPVINDAGTIAFAANLSGGSGIFTQYGLLAKSGDLVDGKVIHEVDYPAINNWGSVAFRASFTDGTQGIVVYSNLFNPNSLVNLLLSNITLALVNGQSMRLTAGAPAGGQCAAELGFANSNGNPVGPSLRVNLLAGQTESLTLTSDILGLPAGQRVELRPVVTPLAGAPAQCGAIAEVVDNQSGLTSIMVPGTAASSAQPSFPAMEVAMGQTLQLNAVANGSTPCSAQLSFVDSTGKPAGPSTVVNLSPGHAAFLDISVSVPYEFLRPIVTPVPGAAASTCNGSIELFDHASGRTLAYATGQ
jgi:hypothetical protein